MKLEKEIDCSEITTRVREAINQLFAVESHEITVVHNNGDIEFQLDLEKVVVVNFLESFDTRVFFSVKQEETNRLSLLEYDAITDKAFVHSLIGINSGAMTLKSLPGTTSEYFILIGESNLVRLRLEGKNSSITALCDLNRHIAFGDEKVDSKWLENIIPFGKNTVLLHFRDEDIYAQKLLMLDIQSDKITVCIEFEYLYGGEFFTNGAKSFAIFEDSDKSSDLECYDINLKMTTKYIDEKYDYYQNVKVDYCNKKIYMIAGKRRGEGVRNIFDLLVLDLDFKLLQSHENIYPHHSNYDFWLNYDFNYDIENNLIYFDEYCACCAYNFVNKTFIANIGVPIFLYLNGSKITYKHENDDNNRKLTLINQSEHLKSAEDWFLANPEAAENFKKLLESIGINFYKKYLKPIQQAAQQNDLENYLKVSIEEHDSIISDSSWKSEEMTFFAKGLHAIADAVRQGYDREL